MKFLEKFSDQLKKSNLTVKYSDSNDDELACIWEYNCNDESVMIINRFKINIADIKKLTKQETEFILNDFLNPKEGDDMNALKMKRLMDIINKKYDLLVQHKENFRGKFLGKKFGL